MEPFVCTSLVQLLCRTVKLAWSDSDAATSIVDDCKVCNVFFIRFFLFARMQCVLLLYVPACLVVMPTPLHSTLTTKPYPLSLST